MPLRLTRKESESIVIFHEDKEILITIEKIGLNQVSLIFDGNKEIEILREELLED